MKDHSVDVLRIFYDGMLKKGVRRNLFCADIDNKFTDTLNLNNNIQLTLDECQKLADICLAKEWLEQTRMGTKYNKLRLTTSGFDYVQSRLTQIETLENRSLLKKISDYLNDHSGIVALVSFIVTFFSLIVSWIALKK